MRFLVIPIVILVGLFGVRLVAQAVANAGTYVAVCVDSRTMSRVEPLSNCESGASTNYRWWYVGKGDPVPAAGAPVDLGAGTLQRPGSNPTITYGYAPEGGVAH